MRKRVLNLILMSLLLVVLYACGNNHLSNPYFENESNDDWETSQYVFEDYLKMVNDAVDTYYPENLDTFINMSEKEGYIDNDLDDKDVIKRSDYVNYNLSDDRVLSDNLWLLNSDLTIPAHLSQFYLFKDFYFNMAIGAIKDLELDEGERFYSNNRIKDFNFYREDQFLWLSFSYEDSLFEHSIEIYGYISDQSKKVLELTITRRFIENNEMALKSFSRFIEGIGETSYYVNLNTNQIDVEYLKTNIDQVKEDMDIFYYRNSGTEYFTHIYLASTKEVASYRTLDNEPTSMVMYGSFVKHKLKFVYTPDYYMVNLYEVYGWDELHKLDSNRYALYHGDVELFSGGLNGASISDTWRNSEYPVFTYTKEGEDKISDEIISLHIIGLDVSYTVDQFEQRSDALYDIFEDEVDNLDSLMIIEEVLNK